jgi:hypothetical protein
LLKLTPDPHPNFEAQTPDQNYRPIINFTNILVLPKKYKAKLQAHKAAQNTFV